MRLSTIFELLLIFLLIAFAAYARVIEPSAGRKRLGQTSAMSLKQAAESVNKYCVCNESICNCCRDFHIPLVQLSGPGCASLQYLQDNKLAMQLSIGDNILSSNVVNGNNPKPVCVNLPGGFSKFCGKIYSIKKEADKNFRACLSLELRSGSELEASLRVSCFRFGPDGLKLRPAEALPPAFAEPPAASSDDEYEDIFGLDDEDDEDEEDDEQADDEEKLSAAASAGSAAEQQAEPGADEEEDDDDDLLGLSALFDIFAGDDDSSGGGSKKPRPAASSTPLPNSFTIPILALTSPAPSVVTGTYPAPNKVSGAPTLLASHDEPASPTEAAVETTTTSSGEQADDDRVQTETKKTVMAESSGNKSKVHATQVKKQSDKKKLAPSKPAKVDKQAIKQQAVGEASEPLLDITAESIYDDDSDEDAADDEELDEGTNDADEAAASSELDDDYAAQSSDEDSDESEDVEVMSTLLDDDISKEQTSRPNDKKAATNHADAAATTAASSDFDYELSKVLARKRKLHPGG